MNRCVSASLLTLALLPSAAWGAQVLKSSPAPGAPAAPAEERLTCEPVGKRADGTPEQACLTRAQRRSLDRAAAVRRAEAPRDR